MSNWLAENYETSINAEVWAKEFMRLFGDRKDEIDESLMISWFANTIMRGVDEKQRELQDKYDDICNRYQIATGINPRSEP